MLAGCSGKPPAANDQAASNDQAMQAPAEKAAGGQADRNVAANSDGGVNPLGSTAVKDAIHRALRTGETQRWSDAGLSGYAVPSPTADARGCRTIRYTIDQQPARSFPIITACDAG